MTPGPNELGKLRERAGEIADLAGIGGAQAHFFLEAAHIVAVEFGRDILLGGLLQALAGGESGGGQQAAEHNEQQWFDHDALLLARGSLYRLAFLSGKRPLASPKHAIQRRGVRNSAPLQLVKPDGQTKKGQLESWPNWLEEKRLTKS